MQVENRNNYNTLGRMGPIYPREEFRPPKKNPTELTTENDGLKGDGDKKKTQKESESLILSAGLKGKGAKSQSIPERLNLAGIKALVSQTSESISELAPQETSGCPHRQIEGYGLLYPTYA
jgi:hypothetical protein